MKLKKLFRKSADLTVDEGGVTLVEYGVAIALAIAVGAPVMALLANNVTNQVNNAGTTMA